MAIPIEKCNPYVRAAEFQHAVLEGEGHRHAYDMRLFAVLDGSGALVIDKRECAVSKGTAIFIPLGCGYYFRGKMRVAVLNFDMTRACDNKNKAICPSPVSYFNEDDVFDKTFVSGFEKPLVLHGCNELVSKFTDIVTAFQRCDTYSDVVTSALAKSLLVDILKLTDTDIKPEKRLAEKIQGFVRMYASQISGNDDIARYFGYHPVYIATVFKNETGKTLHSAIIEQRVADACRWLLQTNASIDVIAESTGFSSRPHFCTVFKKHTGVTPNNWRKNKL